MVLFEKLKMFEDIDGVNQICNKFKIWCRERRCGDGNEQWQQQMVTQVKQEFLFCFFGMNVI